MAKFTLFLILAVVLPTSASMENCSEPNDEEVSTMMQVQFSKRDVTPKDYKISTSSLDGCLLKLNYTEYSAKLQGMSSDDKRNTVIYLLNRKGKGSISDLQGKNNEQLFSTCWQTVAPGKSSLDECLLKTGTRNTSDLNDMSEMDKRNTEIVMLNTKGKGSISDLQGAGDGKLYSMCFEEVLLSMQCYLDRYPVVVDLYGKGNLTGAEEHYDTNGKSRGLDPQCRDISKFDDICNWQCYLDYNPGLAKNVGKTNTAAARKHYDSFGYREGRICFCITTTTTTAMIYNHLNKCGACMVDPGNYGNVLPVYANSCLCQMEEAWCKDKCNGDFTCTGYSSSPSRGFCQYTTDKWYCEDQEACIQTGVEKPYGVQCKWDSFCQDLSIEEVHGIASGLMTEWTGCNYKKGTSIKTSNYLGPEYDYDGFDKNGCDPWGFNRNMEKQCEPKTR